MEQAKTKFGQIYDNHVNSIYRFVFLKVSSKEIAEDLTAETFTRVWRTFKKNKPPKDVKSFCYKTARNLVIDHYRKKGLRQFVSIDSMELPSNENLHEQVTINSDMEMVMKAIKKINNDYQDIIIWRYLDELSISEISKLLNKSQGTTRVKMHRALESLKNVLES